MRHFIRVFTALCAALTLCAQTAAGAERLCDTAFEDCRQPLIDLIRAENVGIDVSFWFMQDGRYSAELIKRWQAGVPVRVLMDTQANPDYPGNAQILQTLKDAGIPMREKSGGSGILHWKLMLFAGQGQLEFSGANYSSEGFVPIQPYVNYVDEVIFFTDDPSIIGSFKTRYDDAWTDTTVFSNYANIGAGEPTRRYPTFPIDPELQFSPYTSFASRSVSRYNAETAQNGGAIDSIMYRITDRRHADALIAAMQRGVPVRLITEPQQYRDPTRLWDSWNVDRLYAAGAHVRFRGHEGLTHEKLTLLRGQQMAVFGSSNWTSASDQRQHEHNLFTTKAWFYQWAVDHFERKWNNQGPSPETQPFAPLPPDAPVMSQPVNGAQEQPASVTLKWFGGPWAHRYDVYLGTSPSALVKVLDDADLGPSESPNQYQSQAVGGLAQATTYYWQVVSRTMANMEKTGPIWSFRTQGAPPPAGGSDVVLWAVRAGTHPGWIVTPDTAAAGGSRLRVPNAGAPKLTSPLASPSTYFDLQFAAVSGVPYRIWIRGKADSNSYENDSVYAQFSDSVTSGGSPTWQIGSASGTTLSVEQGSGAGLSGWGWNDNGYGAGNTLGQPVYFTNSGTHTVRIQVREDGISIDQIVLSPGTFLMSPPGLAQNDGTIYAEQGGSGTPPASGLPDGWDHRDIGGPAVAGSATYSGGTFTVGGSGADIWGASDQFQFAYTTWTGDGSVVARVDSVDNVASWTKAGVMMRAALSANAAQASMFVSSGKGLAFQRRTTTGGNSTHTAGPSSGAPYWVRLVRVGDVITASASPTGVNWTTVGSETIVMPATIYVGLPVSSHDDGTIASAQFSNVSVSSDTGGPPPQTALPDGWSHQDIGGPATGGDATFTAGLFTVSGSGADIWGTSDQLHLAYMPWTGDGSIVAEVESVSNTDRWTKSGVMMRASLDADAAHASMFVTPGKGLAFQRRTAAGGESTHTGGPSATAPYWVQLIRTGDAISGYVSPDGASWTLVGTDTVAMPDTIFVGLPIAGHAGSELATATLSHVTVSSDTAVPPS